MPPTSAAIDVPPPKVIQAALRKTTERLATELASPTDAAPDWSCFEWHIARAVAAIHGVSPLLSLKLKWDGPAGWNRFLTTQREHTSSRQRRIEALLCGIDERAREENVAMVGLKGSALHAMGLYATGERPMADIDLLVNPRDSKRATDVLESLGFHESYSNWKHQVFVPEVQETHTGIGEHAGNYIKIELHERIGEILPLRTSDVTELVFPRQAQPGLNTYPSKASLMIHLLLHAAGSMASRTLRLLHLHDLALLSSQMAGTDWDELIRLGAGARGHWWALPPLQLTSRYYPQAIPTHVLALLAGDCPWMLSRIVRHRTLSDVSLSYLWIEAFPGIGWSQSIPEMLKYIASRVRPGKEMLHLRQVMVETQVPASQSSWGRMSQSRRMLQWIVSRPPRAETMHAVRAALARA